MLTIEMLPASYGDCLWIEYGDAKDPKRILIDGGTTDTLPALLARIESVGGPCRFELVVITHIDIDHIGGALKLLGKVPKSVTIGEVWFNAYRHLPVPDDKLGPKQGEEVSKMLDSLVLPWNTSFGGGAVVVPDSGALPENTLAGGAKLTLLSPYREHLAKLRDVWEDALPEEGLLPGGGLVAVGAVGKEQDDTLGDVDVATLAGTKFKKDDKAPNGSSIAMLLEVEKKRILLGADAFAPALEKSILRLGASSSEPLRLDAFKVPHHGSKKNLSSSLLKLLRCKRYLVSTNGKKFEHPDREAIARILVHGGDQKALCFNYRSDFTKVWDDDELREEHGYTTVFPDDGAEGLTIAL